jgi:hypothetical protein
MYDSEFISRLTKTTRNQRERMVELYSTVDEETRLALIAEQVKISRRLRQEHYQPEKNTEYIYACVILSVKDCLAMSAIARKKSNVNLRLLDNVRIKSAMKKAEGKKRRLIRLRYFSLIQRLKEEEHLTWSEISSYLAKNHRFQVTAGYLQQVVLSLRKSYTAP